MRNRILWFFVSIYLVTLIVVNHDCLIKDVWTFCDHTFEVRISKISKKYKWKTLIYLSLKLNQFWIDKLGPKNSKILKKISYTLLCNPYFPWSLRPRHLRPFLRHFDTRFSLIFVFLWTSLTFRFIFHASPISTLFINLAWETGFSSFLFSCFSFLH